MHLTNLHTHTKYCDGKYSAEDMIIAAINNNMQSIGISTHGPLPFASDWNIQKMEVDNYIDEIINLKQKYNGTIEVYLGMELDYLPGIGFDEYTLDLIKRLDYYIGSVHFLAKFNNGVMWTVDYNLDELMKGIDESFNGNIRIAVETYYDYIGEMALEYKPHIIGHFDLFKKNNINNILFDENEKWYIDAVEKCLSIIAKTPCIVEINTGGIARGYTNEQYPSTFILKMIKEKDIPVIINSDAHSTDGINCKFEDIYKLVYDLGFEKISYLSENGWKNQIIKIV
ncbi:histidinol-phosphatase (PHP family) [Sedimentibacter acidaminivorans]|uniref:Histidinol-phosphatase n=1 Tax=Sedimentibacter acidaminivorans TaxID=913099 RepID=A0ABS4GBB5_9FIRM|nr:histidinol-phosphatase [Sedimentibacter acidaminivorans]MBP1924978.1 histidinol-phosphatase (PHP family) [Sedimentibacter acidaminivorans]